MRKFFGYFIKQEKKSDKNLKKKSAKKIIKKLKKNRETKIAEIFTKIQINEILEFIVRKFRYFSDFTLSPNSAFLG